MYFTLYHITKWRVGMVSIDELIEVNKTNHFKLLTIVGNNKVKIDTLIKYLKKKNWSIYDVEKIVLNLVENIPEEEIKLSIGSLLKQWSKTTGGKVVFHNANILFSPEMNKIGPFSAFQYGMRGAKEGILFMDGKLRGNEVIYSEPGRPDYHKRDVQDVIHIPLDEVDIMEV